MSGLTAARRTELEDELTALETRLALYVAAEANALASGMKSYKLDTGEGSQSATYMDVDKLSDKIDLIKSQIASRRRILTGGSVRRITVNRKLTTGITNVE